jgi:hypothetical protein
VVVANRTKFTLKAREEFLAALRGGNTITHAARLVRMSRRGVYDVRNADPTFAAEWDLALAEGIDVLEQEAKRRAVEGVEQERPIVSRGMIVGHVRTIEYSDRLLELLLKAKKPDVYRENVSVEQRGRVRHDHQHVGRVDLRLATEEEMDVLERIAQRSALNGHAG